MPPVSPIVQTGMVLLSIFVAEDTRPQSRLLQAEVITAQLIIPAQAAKEGIVFSLTHAPAEGLNMPPASPIVQTMMVLITIFVAERIRPRLRHREQPAQAPVRVLVTEGLSVRQQAGVPPLAIPNVMAAPATILFALPI